MPTQISNKNKASGDSILLIYTIKESIDSPMNELSSAICSVGALLAGAEVLSINWRHLEGLVLGWHGISALMHMCTLALGWMWYGT